MSKVVCGITMSIDGYVAGLNMSEEKPFGDISPQLLHRWQFEDPENNKEERAYLRSVAGANIMGRNMYGPAGSEYDKNWKGWWGEEPPYHAPVFVLTHRPHEPVVMKGGTTFIFVTDGIESALRQAKEAAGEKPVLIAGGADTVNQYLAAGLIDELWLHIAPVTVGKGHKLFEGVTDLKMEPIDCRSTKFVTHIKYKKI
jgi:dihydrofolate reductase